jgi:hypothetical protein
VLVQTTLRNNGVRTQRRTGFLPKSFRTQQLCIGSSHADGRHAELSTLGAALYRAGRFDAAVQRLQEDIRVRSDQRTVWDKHFLAMAHHRLNHTGEARGGLAQARAQIQELEKRGQKNDEWLIDYHRAGLRQLQREAEALIEGSAAEPEKEERADKTPRRIGFQPVQTGWKPILQDQADRPSA